MKTNCTGCTMGDQKCNCTIEVLRDNEFDIRILLDTDKGLKWCPKSTLDSDFFNCQSETFMRIRASQVCDSFGDCPGQEDEAKLLCDSNFLKIMICVVVLFVYSLALALVVCYSCRAGRTKSKKSENRQDRRRQAIKQNLKEIHRIVDQNDKLKRSEIKTITEKMSKKIRLDLIAAAANVPTGSQTKTLLKPVVLAAIPEGEDSKEMLIAVKNHSISDRLKNKIFSTHAQSTTTRIKAAILNKIPNKGKNKLSFFGSISAEVLNLLTTAMQDIKDLGVIATMFFFYNEVLQQRPWLIDGINLNHYVALLSGIYVFNLISRLLRVSNTLTREENKEISPVVRMIPFFNEIFLSFKIIQGTVKLFKMKATIATSLENQNSKSEDDEAVWEKVTTLTEKINQRELKLEKRKAARMRVKVCSVLGDIMQACVLAILLLRSDLRVRGALISLKQTNFMGGKSNGGGIQGN